MPMLLHVHHVQYVVRNRDEAVAYWEKNFGLKPYHQADLKSDKQALYHVGQTQLAISEPTDPDTELAHFLAEHGPSVQHVAWGVENISEVAKELVGKGTTLRDGLKIHKAAHGYNVINILPEAAMGIFHLQLAENLK